MSERRFATDNKNNELSFEDVFSESNIAYATQLIVRKNSMPGLDGISSKRLPEYWEANRKRIQHELENDTYNPTPCKMYFKAKPGKKEKRQIAIYTTLDRMIQQCIRIEAEQVYAQRFHPKSYGFIIGRGTIPAIEQCLSYMNRGMVHIVDADIRKCFDKIKHRIILKKLNPNQMDPRIFHLFSKYLKTPGIVGRRILYHRIGLPQGSCLSPLLANITLNGLDWFLNKEHIPFVRYADDLLLFAYEEKKASSYQDKLDDYLRSELGLKLNKEKTRICKADEVEFLGYGFKKENGVYGLSVPDRKREKFRKRMELYLNRKSFQPKELIEMIGAVNRGWIGYYQRVNANEMIPFLNEMDAEELSELKLKLTERKANTNGLNEDLEEDKRFVTLTDWYYELDERRNHLKNSKT